MFQKFFGALALATAIGVGALAGAGSATACPPELVPNCGPFAHPVREAPFHWACVQNFAPPQPCSCWENRYPWGHPPFWRLRGW